MKTKDYLILGGAGLAAYFLFIAPKVKEAQDLAGGVGGVVSGVTTFIEDLSKIPQTLLSIPQQTANVALSPLLRYNAPDLSSDLSVTRHVTQTALAGGVGGITQYLGTVAAATPVSFSLPKSSGTYSPTSFTYTSPQGYKMSVAPQNVASQAAKFTPKPLTNSQIAATNKKYFGVSSNPFFK
jgi:hypothetical protein